MRYHARPISYETVDTENLVYRIHERCSLSPSDVIATLEELKYEVAQCLKEGKKVHIDGLGYLQVTLSCEEERIGIPAEYKPHSTELSNTEIDMELTKYFARIRLLPGKTSNISAE